jgi:hypothetical protein
VAGERDLGAAAEGITVDGGDYRLGEIFDGPGQGLTLAGKVPSQVGIEVDEFADVRARDEGLFSAG